MDYQDEVRGSSAVYRGAQIFRYEGDPVVYDVLVKLHYRIYRLTQPQAISECITGTLKVGYREKDRMRSNTGPISRQAPALT